MAHTNKNKKRPVKNRPSFTPAQRKNTTPSQKAARKKQPRKTSRRPLAAPLLFLAGAGTLIGVLYLTTPKIDHPVPNGKPFATPEKLLSNRPKLNSSQLQTPVRPCGHPLICFFPASDNEQLIRKKIPCKHQSSPRRRAELIISRLSTPTTTTTNPLPVGTKLLGIEFKAPLITINLNHELAARLSRYGASDELTAVTCLTNSFLKSFPGYTCLQILIAGQHRKTLAGHIDISHPLSDQ